MHKEGLAVLLDRPIAFHRVLVDLAGSVVSALFLSQAIYWQRRCEGWFWKTQDQWEEETGLSRREQETARSRLRDLAFIQEDRRGNPAKLWFRVDLERVQTRLAESANLDCTKAPIKIGGKRQSIKEAETTTETTTEKETTDLFQLEHVTPRKTFQIPTIEAIQAYCKERQNTVDPFQFHDFYIANGWKVGRNPMKDWKATIRYWERNGRNGGSSDGYKTSAQLRNERNKRLINEAFDKAGIA